MNNLNAGKAVILAAALTLNPVLGAKNKEVAVKEKAVGINQVKRNIDALNALNFITVSGIVIDPPANNYGIDRSIKTNKQRREKLQKIVKFAQQIKLTEKDSAEKSKGSVKDNIKALNDLKIIKVSGVTATPYSSDYGISQRRNHNIKALKLNKLLELAKKL